MIQPIQDVLSAEKEAKRTIEKAEANYQTILTTAKQETLILIAEEQKKIDARQQQRVEKARQEIEKRAARIRDEAAEKAGKLGRQAGAKLESASDLILAELDLRMG